MDNTIISQKTRYDLKKRRFRRWKSVVTALACVVVFCTTYALILPAITLEETVYCGYEEHAHTEECYEDVLICDISEETEFHTHAETCYEEETRLICSLEESEGHSHMEECAETELVLVCDLEEKEGHIHVEECNVIENVLNCG